MREQSECIVVHLRTTMIKIIAKQLNMPKYRYTIVNPGGKKLSGIIEGKNEEEARGELNALGFSILEIAEISAEETEKIEKEAPGAVVFEFEAIDKSGKKIAGTIASTTKYDAFKRLIKEYNFDVESICTAAAPLDEKEEEKAIGVVDLYTQLRREEAEETAKGKKPTVEAFEEKKEREAYLANQVNFVIEKVKLFLSEMGDQIKPEEKSEIEKELNHLLRIRASTNLDYIRNTAEGLLKMVQKKEIFITEKVNEQKARSFSFEARKLLADIHKERITRPTKGQLIEKIKTWQAENIVGNPNPAFKQRFINSIYEIILDIIEEPPEVIDLKKRMRIVKSQLFDYTKIYLKETNPEDREEIKKSLSSLRQEYKRLKLELRNIKRKIKEEVATKREYTISERFLQELSSLTGWLVFFYLAFAILGNYFTNKKIIEPIPSLFLATNSYTFLFILGILFLIHIAIATKTIYFIKKSVASMIIFPASLVLLLLYAFNF